MEEKLFAAAAQLPEPKGDFLGVEERAKKETAARWPNQKKRLVPVILALCLMVTACAYSTTKYGLWGGYSSHSFGDVEALGEKYGYTFPETLNGSPYLYMHTAYGAPEGYSRLQALLMPTYRLYTIRYGIEKQEQREDGLYMWGEKQISVSFGTTEKEPWKYHFSVAEDGSKNYHGVNPGSNRAVEYEGYTLHLYSIGDSHSVMWEDKGRNMIIDMTCYDLASQEESMEIAKILIDLNREESQETTEE